VRVYFGTQQHKYTSHSRIKANCAGINQQECVFDRFAQSANVKCHSTRQKMNSPAVLKNGDKIAQLIFIKAGVENFPPGYLV